MKRRLLSAVLLAGAVVLAASAFAGDDFLGKKKAEATQADKVRARDIDGEVFLIFPAEVKASTGTWQRVEISVSKETWLRVGHLAEAGD